MAKRIADTPLSVPYDSPGNVVFKPTPDAQRDNPLSDVDELARRQPPQPRVRNAVRLVQHARGARLPRQLRPRPDLRAQRRRSSARRRRRSRAPEAMRPSATSKTFDYTLDNLLTYKKSIGTAHQRGRHAALLDREADVRGELRLLAEPAVRVGAVLQPRRWRRRRRNQQRRSRQWSLQSYMARVNYTLLDKYLLTLTDSRRRLVAPRRREQVRHLPVGRSRLARDRRRAEPEAGTSQQPQAARVVRRHRQHVGRSVPDAGRPARHGVRLRQHGRFRLPPRHPPERRAAVGEDGDSRRGRRLRPLDGRLTGTIDYYRANTTDLLHGPRPPAIDRLLAASRRTSARRGTPASSSRSRPSRSTAGRGCDGRTTSPGRRTRTRSYRSTAARSTIRATSGSSASRSTAAATTSGTTTSSSASGRRPMRPKRPSSAASPARSRSPTSTTTVGSTPTTR